MTDATQDRAAEMVLELAAVASPGQTVFIEAADQATRDQIEKMYVEIGSLAKKAGVYVVILSNGVKVARIGDAE